jgi:hypothetical protein
MTDLDFDFRGGREIEAALEGLGNPTQLRRIATNTLRKAAVPMRDAWSGKVDVEKGLLRDNIKVGPLSRRNRQAERRRADPTTASVFIGVDLTVGNEIATYASIEEFGNDRQSANPAGRQAFEGEVQAALNIAAEEIWTQIGKRRSRIGLPPIDAAGGEA